MRLQGKVIIVTGGGQGLGRSFALALAAEGAAVVVAEINEARGSAVAQEITARGRQALFVGTDVSDAAQADEMARITHQTYGRIDGLVNNAAIYYGLKMKPFDTLSLEEWRRIMEVNVDGPFYCARAVVPFMRAQGSGRIINVASGAYHLPVPGIAHYIASKGAVVGFTRALACELGEAGITVNAIAPGFTLSEASRVLAGQELADAIAARQCIKRSEMPEDLNGAVLFLASDDSSFITGQTLTVDGGTSFH